jgi:hypothetical protein
LQERRRQLRADAEVVRDQGASAMIGKAIASMVMEVGPQTICIVAVT